MTDHLGEGLPADRERAAVTDKVERSAPANRRANRDSAFEIAFGQRIRAARLAANMSQAALGKAAGVSFQQVQKYELGKDRVSVGTLQGIATALGVHPAAFFDESVPVPVGPITDVKAAFKAAEVLGQIRDPRVLKQMLALAKVLAEGEP